MYYIDRTVAFSEVAPDRLIKITNLTDYYQDVCTFQSEELGVGMDYLRKLGFGWVASSWQIEVLRYPELNEKIRVGTAPYEFKGVCGLRNFVMETKDGEVLSRANSVWAFISLDTMSLSRVPQEIVAAYTVEPKLDMDYASRRIKIPGELAAGSSFAVGYHNLDSNDHVNNAQYISMAEDIIPEGRRARQIRVEYRASARYGDVITPFVNHSGDVHTVVMSDAATTDPYVIVEFTV